MSGILQKLGAEKVKHHLEIDIHYVRARLRENCSISIEVQRGKKMHKETQPIAYSLSSSFVQFDYPIAFDITMHKKGTKYVKKNFVIKLHEIEGNNKVNNGRVKIDFSQIPVLNKPIVRREVPLQHCTDKSAVVCISVKLDQLAKTRGTLPGGISPNSSLLSPNSSLLTSEENLKKKQSEARTPSLTDPLANPVPVDSKKKAKGNNKEEDRAISPEKNTSPRPVPIEIVEEHEELYQTEDLNDSICSRMSFSDLILNPRESEVSSESSSSEEEVKELPAERLVAHAMPKARREQVTPNEGSKELHIARIEEQSGVSTRGGGNCCTACTVF